MRLTHLLDASVLKRMNRPAIAAAVEQLGEGVGRASITDLEIGFSARNGAEWDRLSAALASLRRVATTSAHIDRALHVQRLLAERSQRGRKLPDLLVAAAAEDAGLTVVHYDADFDLIAAVTGQPVEWVVPAGSADR